MWLHLAPWMKILEETCEYLSSIPYLFTSLINLTLGRGRQQEGGKGELTKFDSRQNLAVNRSSLVSLSLVCHGMFHPKMVVSNSVELSLLILHQLCGHAPCEASCCSDLELQDECMSFVCLFCCCIFQMLLILMIMILL